MIDESTLDKSDLIKTVHPCFWQALVTHVNINMGKITMLLPHPGAVVSALGSTPLTQCYGEAMASVVSKCRAQNHHKEKHKCGGWHARFKLQRHGLQVNHQDCHSFYGKVRLPQPSTTSNYACVLRIPSPPSYDSETRGTCVFLLVHSSCSEQAC